MTTTDTRAGVELAPFTTLRLGGPARRFVDAADAAQLVAAVRDADTTAEPLLLLGGGSNLVIGDAGFEGVVVRVATRGQRLERLGERRVRLTVEAGEDWDEVVAASVAEGLGGLECLSGIPGSTGATPVQNVGAYGVETADLLESVDLLDRYSGEVRTVPAAELGLAFRTSMLKGVERAVVLRVRFLLREDGLSAPIRYAELAHTLGVPPEQRVPVADARAAVLGLRRGKGMVLDVADHDTWSVGSFFLNPLLEDAEAARVLARVREQVGPDVPVPQWPGGPGRTKLSAAWLIERAGFSRGHPGPGGRVALSSKHALALTNRGGASTADLLVLAAEIRDGVRACFGLALRPEPILVGCAL